MQGPCSFNLQDPGSEGVIDNKRIALKLDSAQFGDSLDIEGQIRGTLEARGIRVGGNLNLYPILYSRADFSGSKIEGNLCLSEDMERTGNIDRALQFVCYSSPEDRRKLSDTEPDERLFNGKVFNQASNGLILKHVRVRQALRVHQLLVQIDGDDRSDRVAWLERFREPRRKLLRRVSKSHRGPIERSGIKAKAFDLSLIHI